MARAIVVDEGGRSNVMTSEETLEERSIEVGTWQTRSLVPIDPWPRSVDGFEEEIFAAIGRIEDPPEAKGAKVMKFTKRKRELEGELRRYRCRCYPTAAQKRTLRRWIRRPRKLVASVMKCISFVCKPRRLNLRTGSARHARGDVRARGTRSSMMDTIVARNAPEAGFDVANRRTYFPRPHRARSRRKSARARTRIPPATRAPLAHPSRAPRWR